MKVCQECTWFVNDRTLHDMQMNSEHRPKCGNPDAFTRDPVFGRCYCDVERASKNKGACGKEGKLWTAPKK